MQNVEQYKPEPISKAFLSIEAVAAIACMIFFWATITHLDPNASSGKQGAEVDPIANVDSPEIIKRANSSKPLQLAREGKFTEAQEAADVLIKQNSHNVFNNVAAGNALIMTGARDNGLALLKKAVALSPKNRYVRLNYAEKLVDCGNNDEGIAQYQMLSKSYANWIEPHTRLANLYYKLDKNQEAADELGTIVKLDSNNAQARKMLGLALAKAGQPGKGLDEYVLGVSKEMQTGLPEALRGLVRDWGTVDRTIFELQQQVNNRPEDYMPKLRLAQLYAYTGNARDAKELLLDARRNASANPEVHRTLAIVLRKLGENNVALSEFMLSVAYEKAKAKGEKKAAAESQN